MSSADYKFEGWMGLDANAAKGNMVWQSYEPKAFQETDIDVRCPPPDSKSGIFGRASQVKKSSFCCPPHGCLKQYAKQSP